MLHLRRNNYMIISMKIKSFYELKKYLVKYNFFYSHIINKTCYKESLKKCRFFFLSVITSITLFLDILIIFWCLIYVFYLKMFEKTLNSYNLKNNNKCYLKYKMKNM